VSAVPVCGFVIRIILLPISPKRPVQDFIDIIQTGNYIIYLKYTKLFYICLILCIKIHQLATLFQLTKIVGLFTWRLKLAH